MYLGKYKVLSLCLALCALLSLISCGTGDGVTDTTNGGSYGEGDVSNDVDYICDLPEHLDYNTEVNYLYTDLSGRSDELLSEGLGGGVILDAVYERNVDVCTRLGVELHFSPESSDVEAVSAIARLVQAGDKSIDIFTVGTYVCMTPVLAGHYLNLNDVEYIDLSKHYWNQDYNEMMTFTSQNLQYVATSPTAISIFRKGYLTIFNRELFQDYQIPELYQAVENGEWTLDYQYKIIKDIYADANGSSKRDLGDLYGLVVGNETDMDVYAVSSDIHMAVRDQTGDLIYNADAFVKLVDMTEKVSALCHSNGTYLANSFDEGFNLPIEQFSQKKALMATAMFGHIETYIQYLADISYGIAPIPKLYREQATYGTYIQDQVSSFGISASIGDTKRQAILGAVMEAMSYHSYVRVRPAYYDSVLSLRFMQDPQSRDILDTMFESISFDYVYATGLGKVRDHMRGVISATDPAIASKEKVWQRQIEAALRDQSEAFDKLSGQT